MTVYNAWYCDITATVGITCDFGCIVIEYSVSIATPIIGGG